MLSVEAHHPLCGLLVSFVPSPLQWQRSRLPEDSQSGLQIPIMIGPWEPTPSHGPSLHPCRRTEVSVKVYSMKAKVAVTALLAVKVIVARIGAAAQPSPLQWQRSRLPEDSQSGLQYPHNDRALGGHRHAVASLRPCRRQRLRVKVYSMKAKVAVTVLLVGHGDRLRIGAAAQVTAPAGKVSPACGFAVRVTISP